MQCSLYFGRQSTEVVEAKKPLENPAEVSSASKAWQKPTPYSKEPVDGKQSMSALQKKRANAAEANVCTLFWKTTMPSLKDLVPETM